MTSRASIVNADYGIIISNGGNERGQSLLTLWRVWVKDGRLAEAAAHSILWAREFERRMKQARLEPGDQELVRRGWRIGAEDFRDWLADKLARRGRKRGTSQRAAGNRHGFGGEAAQ
jgi:hypothetical protein